MAPTSLPKSSAAPHLSSSCWAAGVCRARTQVLMPAVSSALSFAHCRVPVASSSSRATRGDASVAVNLSEAKDQRQEMTNGVEDVLEQLNLMSLSPLDGRYARQVEQLRPFFSEFGLIRYRLFVEVKWLLKLSQLSQVTEVPPFSKDAEDFLERIFTDFSISDALEVKSIERVTNHDVKAVEYFLKKKCTAFPEVEKVKEFFHFGCTSEDINNLAYGLAIKEALNTVMFPVMVDLCISICNLAKQYAHVPMLSRTHGQPASPTTLGKEMANFAYRLHRQWQAFSRVELLGKFAGAVGNYNAHKAAFPDINWPKVAADFVESLGLQFNPYVTQIEPHDYIAELFDTFVRFNSIVKDFDQDIWSYISLNYFKQMPKAGEIGSSTMPHKVNPIDFENSEGNICMANGNLSALADKLPISRMQRDLTDSTVLRNLGIGLGYSLLAYKSAIRGINMLQVNENRLVEDLERTWEVLAEPIQTVMRRYGVPEPYEKLKALTRGQVVTVEKMQAFVDELDLPAKAKAELLAMTPHSYTGEGQALAESLDQFIDFSSIFKV